MMIFLFFVLSCAATVFSEEIVKKIPTFVATFELQKRIHEELGLISYETLPTPENLYKRVLEKPVIILSLVGERDKDEPSFHFASGGLQNLLKDPETKALAKQLTDDDQVTVVIYQKSPVPFEMFAKTLEATLKVPEHWTTLETLMEPPPLVAFIPKNELEPINNLARLDKVSDLKVEGNDIHMSNNQNQPMNMYYAPYAPAPAPYDSTLYLVYPDTRNPDNHGPAAPHFATPIPPLPPLNIPNNVGPFYI